MQKMTATKTRTGHENIHLSALSQAGRSNSWTASPTAPTAAPGVPPPPRASIAESYDGEIRQATRSRFVPVEPGNSRPLRVKTRWILKNGISRRTLHVTILFGIVGTVYYGVSLIPPFKGLRYQVESNANNRQTMAYAFLQECATRKLQNLPLGQDCIKYLAMTPKAPPDIDIWMVDPPVSDAKRMRLLIRNFILAAKETITDRGEMLDLTEPCYDGPSTGLLAGHEFAFAMISLALIYIFHPQLKYILGEILWLSILPSTVLFVRRKTTTISMYQLAIWILILSSIVYTLVLLCQTLFYTPTGWVATSEFLTTCKALELSNLPFGPDCTKYLRMQLKPDPTGHAHVLDDPTEHTQVLDSNTAVIIIIALPLGILVSLAAFLAFIGVKREILSRENWSFSFEKGIAR